MDGVLNILKPPGMTSHDVVGYVRRLLGEKRVGHTGTLDPGVAGVLPICVGRATRLAEYLGALGKAYRAEFTFGVATDTQDAYGQITAAAPAEEVTEAALREVLPRFTGEILQVPPMVSAVRVGGRRLYELARAGAEVERSARPVRIERLELLEFIPGVCPVARLDVACSKGTYVRTLAVDVGAALGVPAHLSHLVRTAAGPFLLADAVLLEELAAGPSERWLLPPAVAVAHLPRLAVDAPTAQAVARGQAPPAPAGWQPGPGPIALLAPGGDLIALAELVPGPGAGTLKLLKVFA